MRLLKAGAPCLAMHYWWAIQCHTPLTYNMLVPFVALDPTWLGFILSASRPAIELPHIRTLSAKAFKRFRLLADMILLQYLLSALICEKYFLAPSMARSTLDAFNVVRGLDRSGKPNDSPQDKKQKAATALLRDELLMHDFVGPFSLRATRIFWTHQSLSRVAEILPRMKTCVACLSSWGLLLVFYAWSLYCPKISQLRERNKRADLDARTNPILSHTTTFVPC